MAHRFRCALSTYTESGGTGEPTFDPAQAITVMLEKHAIALDLLHRFHWEAWTHGTPAERLQLLPPGREHILWTLRESARARIRVMVKNVLVQAELLRALGLVQGCLLLRFAPRCDSRLRGCRYPSALYEDCLGLHPGFQIGLQVAATDQVHPGSQEILQGGFQLGTVEQAGSVRQVDKQIDIAVWRGLIPCHGAEHRKVAGAMAAKQLVELGGQLL